MQSAKQHKQTHNSNTMLNLCWWNLPHRNNIKNWFAIKLNSFFNLGWLVNHNLQICWLTLQTSTTLKHKLQVGLIEFTKKQQHSHPETTLYISLITCSQRAEPASGAHFDGVDCLFIGSIYNSAIKICLVYCCLQQSKCFLQRVVDLDHTKWQYLYNTPHIHSHTHGNDKLTKLAIPKQIQQETSNKLAAKKATALSWSDLNLMRINPHQTMTIRKKSI